MKKKLKICVYAICKNEESFVKRWFESMKEADEIYVLDTGSTDKTVELLKQKGVKVDIKEIKPWRFDVARNESLKLVPDDADICVCTDLDEVFIKGWRKKLENIWDEKTTRLSYNYNWSFDEYGKPAVNFYIEKIHTKKDYMWAHPVHEVLVFTGKQEIKKTTDEITVNHYPDNTKSRSNYLPLLELSVEEDPEDDRNMHYLGREYMYYKEWNKCIDTLIRHLNLKTATWKDERCASMRFISRSYKELNRIEEARMWLDKAMKEAPHLRDAFVERALLEYSQENWNLIKFYCEEALKIKEHTKSYINESFSWDHTIYDLLSLSYFYTNNNEKALENVNLAISISPNNDRLLNNKRIIEDSMNI